MPELTQVPQGYQPITVPTKDQLSKELGLVDPDQLKTKEVEDPEIIEKAKGYVRKLIAIDPKDYQGRDLRVESVKQQGREILAELANNVMLDEQIKALATRAADGGDVANALVDLKLKVEELDPHHWDFGPGWLSRILGTTPVVGKKVKKYLTQYESAKTVINATVDSVNIGKQQIIRDSKTLRARQIKLLELSRQLEKLIKVLQASDKELVAAIAAETDPEKKKFFEEELLFNLRQTLNDRLRSLNNKQMGILSFGYILKTNEQLVRAVEFSTTTTLEAIELAVTMRFALIHQKNTLEKVQMMDDVAENLQLENSELAKTQGVEVYKQSTGINRDLTKLKAMFANMHAAMDDIERFKKESLPLMAQNILEMYNVAEENAKRIKRMSDADKVAPALSIDLN